MAPESKPHCAFVQIDARGAAVRVVSFGPTLMSWSWGYQWLYCVGPLIDGGLAGVIYTVLFISHTHEQLPITKLRSEAARQEEEEVEVKAGKQQRGSGGGWVADRVHRCESRLLRKMERTLEPEPM